MFSEIGKIIAGSSIRLSWGALMFDADNDGLSGYIYSQLGGQPDVT